MTNLKKQRKGIYFSLFLLVFFLFFVNFVSAAVDTNIVDDVYQVNEKIRYTKSCINNGTYCSSTASCNFTIYDSDGSSLLANNVVGDNVGTGGASLWEHNITFIKTGVFQIDMVCDDNGEFGSRTMYAQVTGSGDNNTFNFYILILVLTLGFILIGFYKEDAIITLLGSFGLYFFAFEILFNGIAGMKDLTTTWALGLITLGFAMYISVRSAHSLIVD